MVRVASRTAQPSGVGACGAPPSSPERADRGAIGMTSAGRRGSRLGGTSRAHHGVGTSRYDRRGRTVSGARETSDDGASPRTRRPGPGSGLRSGCAPARFRRPVPARPVRARTPRPGARRDRPGRPDARSSEGPCPRESIAGGVGGPARCRHHPRLDRARRGRRAAGRLVATRLSPSGRISGFKSASADLAKSDRRAGQAHGRERGQRRDQARLRRRRRRTPAASPASRRPARRSPARR